MNRIDCSSPHRDSDHVLFKTGNCSDLGVGVQLILAGFVEHLAGGPGKATRSLNIGAKAAGGFHVFHRMNRTGCHVDNPVREGYNGRPFPNDGEVACRSLSGKNAWTTFRMN